MNKNRLEAFSDGVLAILITIMILELKVPQTPDLFEIFTLLPKLLSYGLSFIYIGIYWNNHHHMLHTVKHINGKILWANLNLLFWLSLIPFATAWAGETNFSQFPVILYGVLLLAAALSYTLLSKLIIQSQGSDSLLLRAIGSDNKGKASILLYIFGIAFSFYHPYVSCSFYIIVAIMWLIPDKRIESKF